MVVNSKNPPVRLFSCKIKCESKREHKVLFDQIRTRTIKGGGPNDGFINGGGVVVVNSNDLLIINASVQWKKPPLTHDVCVTISAIKNRKI